MRKGMSIHFSRKTALLVWSSLQKTGLSRERELRTIAQDDGKFTSAGLHRSQWMRHEETVGSSREGVAGARKGVQPPPPSSTQSWWAWQCLSLRAAGGTPVYLVGTTIFKDSICQGDQRP